MIDLFVEGGLYFMIPLTGIALLMVGAAIGTAAAGVTGRRNVLVGKRAVFHLGLFALVFGAFSHALGLYQMMNVIERIGAVSPALVAGGLRVSLVAPLYGLAIFIVAMLLWFVLDRWLESGHTENA